MSPELASALVQALVQGSLYALIGVGFVILYRSTGVLNFAQGSLMVLGGFSFYQLTEWGLPLVAAIPLSVVIVGLIGSGLFVAGFRRLVGEPTFVLVIATLGLSVVIETIVVLIWGPNPRPLPNLIDRNGGFEVLGMRFSPLDVYCIVVCLTIILALDLMLKRTRLGARMRAVADGPLLAGLNKIPVNAMSALAWGIAAFCAAAAGISYSLRTSLDPIGLQGFGLVAFAAVLLGGMDSIRGALLGGMSLAIIQNLAVLWFGGDWTDVIAYTLLLLVLMVRPQGLLGSAAIRRI